MKLLGLMSRRLAAMAKTKAIVKPTKEEWELMCETRALGKMLYTKAELKTLGLQPINNYQEIHTIRVTRSTKTMRMKRDVKIEWSNNRALLKGILTNI